jgi:O-antigen ligase
MERLLKVLLFLFPILPFINLWPYQPYPSWISEATALMMGCLFVGLSFFTPNMRKEVSWNICTPFFMILALIITVSVAVKDLPFYTMAIRILSGLVIAALFSMAIASRENKKETLIILAWGVFAGALLQSVFVILQVSEVIDLYIAWVNQQYFWLPHFPVYAYPTGLIMQRNLLATYMCVALMTSLYLVVEKRLSLWLFYPLLLLCSFAIVSSSSRTSLLYLAGILFLSFFISGKKPQLKKFKWNMVAFVLTTFLMMPIYSHLSPKLESAYDKIQSNSDSHGLGYRWQLWGQGLTIFESNPILGVSPGYLLGASLEHPIEAQQSKIFTHAHNIFVHILAEYGIFAFLLFCFLIFRIGWHFFVNREDVPQWLVLFVCVAFFVHSQLEYPLWYASFLYFFLIFLSLVLPTKSRAPIKITPYVTALIAVGVFAGTAKSVWDYSSMAEIAVLRQMKTDNPNDKVVLTRLSTDPIFSVKASMLLMSQGHLDSTDKNLSEKLDLSSRLIRYRPTAYNLFRHAVHLSLDNRKEDTEQALAHAHYMEPSSIGSMASWFNELPKDPRFIVIREWLIKKHAEERQKKLKKKQGIKQPSS